MSSSSRRIVRSCCPFKEKANKIKVWDEISHVYDSDGVVDGEIIGRIKGGLMVDIG
jgi:small subunit ribosomal protein S1